MNAMGACRHSWFFFHMLVFSACFEFVKSLFDLFSCFLRCLEFEKAEKQLLIKVMFSKGKLQVHAIATNQLESKLERVMVEYFEQVCHFVGPKGS